MPIAFNPGSIKGRIIILTSLVLTWCAAYTVYLHQTTIRQEISSALHRVGQNIPIVKGTYDSSDGSRVKLDHTKVALIIEPRPIPHLVSQILHMTSVVPPDWRFLFIGSEKSYVSVARSIAIKHQQTIGRLDFMILPEPWQIDTEENVSRLLTDIRFYDEFLPGVEWILKYESDSILCSNSGISLNDWLVWSWAGASRSVQGRSSGYGGLSLRRMSAIRRVLGSQKRHNNTEAEDEWFGTRLEALPGEKVASGSNNTLAMEDVYTEKPMGFHVRDSGHAVPDNAWEDPKLRKDIFDYCPELSLIMDMKLERERCP